MADYMESYEEDEVSVENTEELEELKYSGEEERPVFELVRVTKKDFSIYELYRKYRKKQLVLEVEFQRNEVWEKKQKYELIESILMGLPLPIFYFKQQDNATYVVVDGKQRLSTLFDFLNNKFALKSLKILSFLNEKKFGDLTGKLGIYQSQLEDYQVYSHVILPPTPDKILFDIFDRVNRGGTLLNKQEIRNALYHGRGLDMITDITKTEEFVNVTRKKHEKDSRMKGSYLVTRFLSFYLLFQKCLMKDGAEYEYNGDVDELIEVMLQQLNNEEEEALAKIKELTLKSLAMAGDILGRGAFRKELNGSKPINMNIFETTLYFMALLIEKDQATDEEKIKEGLYQVITSAEFLDLIGNSRDYPAKVYRRFILMENLAEVICND